MSLFRSTITVRSQFRLLEYVDGALTRVLGPAGTVLAGAPSTTGAGRRPHRHHRAAGRPDLRRRERPGEPRPSAGASTTPARSRRRRSTPRPWSTSPCRSPCATPSSGRRPRTPCAWPAPGWPSNHRGGPCRGTEVGIGVRSVVVKDVLLPGEPAGGVRRPGRPPAPAAWRAWRPPARRPPRCGRWPTAPAARRAPGPGPAAPRAGAAAGLDRGALAERAAGPAGAGPADCAHVGDRDHRPGRLRRVPPRGARHQSRSRSASREPTAARSSRAPRPENQGLLTNNTIIEMFQVLKRIDRRVSGDARTALRNDASGEIVYVPPQDRTAIVAQMTALERFVNDESVSDLDPLIKMALIHHQFESIHPFPEATVGSPS